MIGQVQQQVQASIEAVNYVEWPEFISVIIALLGLFIAGLWIVISKVVDVREKVSDSNTRLAVVEEQNTGDAKNFEVLYSKVGALEKQRMSDVIQFTEAIGKLNTTLGKIETVMENQTNVMQDLKSEINNLKK